MQFQVKCAVKCVADALNKVAVCRHTCWHTCAKCLASAITVLGFLPCVRPWTTGLFCVTITYFCGVNGIMYVYYVQNDPYLKK